MKKRPLIVDVKRHSMEDGPGIRSVVFFKGCPLRCVFCHNPETRATGPEIAFSPKECIGCGDCVKACPRGAISLGLPLRIDRNLCNGCGLCAEACPGKGLQKMGKHYPVEILGELLLRDKAFYHYSQGGITLSGGECTMHTDYLEELLLFLKPHNIHILVETSGYFRYKTFEKRILPHVDMIYFDLKLGDPRDHIRHTGKSNQRIRKNFSRLLKKVPEKVIPRIPLIPDITATQKNFAMLSRELQKQGLKTPILIPYNPTGMEKYPMMGLSKPHLREHFMTCREEESLKETFESMMK